LPDVFVAITENAKQLILVVGLEGLEPSTKGL